ncbi:MULTISPECIES: FAD-dependent oxidoreductase [Sorangium]|uniref:FAD-dependent oxidoreductase n=1 Tax=Sorangium TaxID=39643 RepID=UPI003D9C1BCD
MCCCWPPRRRRADAAAVGARLRRGRAYRPTLESGCNYVLVADLFIDATPHGELLAIAGVEHVLGPESWAETGEPHAAEHADPRAQQAITVFEAGFEPSDVTIVNWPQSDYGFGPVCGVDEVEAARNLYIGGDRGDRDPRTCSAPLHGETSPHTRQSWSLAVCVLHRRDRRPGGGSARPDSS